MKKILSFCLLFASTQSFAETPQYLQLIDKLDRPNDGYCIDVVGSGEHVRFDMPLTAHNCKGPQVYHDEVVEFREDGTLYFPTYGGCVTVMGNNGTALSGNALMLKVCDAREPFLIAKPFQHFEFNDQQQVQLKNTNLCMVAGDDSHTTFSPDHKWRSLYMEFCDVADTSLSRWHIIEAGGMRP
ncbi:ricin-type beta-trefoil lectin domain protein [Pseudovibrio exalbescens]|uniref:RICIN domain-containing protein n=1 Tax=Pseudovibrio exalbescens TaxID=197461 RepID=UPI002366CA81|nr:RICIN domain-containing protein [Pseudovibrio exalbescens]MDD7910522.1 ricin-type beta-trefoil lectin domain protein [Pseudovibrio exalbescens]